MKHVRLLAKPSYHEEDSEGSWAVSYGDMITLLLSFFVIYFTTEPAGEKLAQQSQMLAFDLQTTANLTSQQSPASQELPELAEINETKMSVTLIGKQLVVTFGSHSFFRSGDTDISPEGAQMLRHFCERYLPYSSTYRLSLKAFTDSRPVKTKRQRRFNDNLELSALRSISAMRVLQKAGLPLKKMELAGAGELRAMSKVIPSADKLSKKEIDALSRTVILVITPEKEGLL